MIKKKEPKKPSAKEDKQLEDNNNIFDTNGKLILQTKQIEEPQLKDKKKPTKVKTISAEEKQKIKQAYWKEYYHRPGNKEKYAEWNRKWREKQKQKKKKSE
jgi:hypothetical protein